MKRICSLILVMTLVMTSLCLPAMAADNYADSGRQDSGIVIGTTGGMEMELVGHIEATIISVTMPSSIPFDISKSLPSANKVVSPRIDVTNNSLVPVTVAVDNTRINLSQLPGVSWSGSGAVNNLQIAVGFAASTLEPSTLDGAMWLKEGKQNLPLLRLDGQSGGILYVVGDIGAAVPENKTFSVFPTLVVRKAL